MSQQLRAATLKALRDDVSLKRYVCQDGKDSGAYKTRWSMESRYQAELYYRCLLIHSGYKKRLIDLKTGEILESYLS